MSESLPNPFHDDDSNDDYILSKLLIRTSNWMDVHETRIRISFMYVIFTFVFFVGLAVLGIAVIVAAVITITESMSDYPVLTLFTLILTIGTIISGVYLYMMVYDNVIGHHENRQDTVFTTVDKHDYERALKDCHVKSTWVIRHQRSGRSMPHFTTVAWTHQPIGPGGSRFICFRSTLKTNGINLGGHDSIAALEVRGGSARLVASGVDGDSYKGFRNRIEGVYGAGSVDFVDCTDEYDLSSFTVMNGTLMEDDSPNGWFSFSPMDRFNVV